MRVSFSLVLDFNLFFVLRELVFAFSLGTGRFSCLIFCFVLRD